MITNYRISRDNRVVELIKVKSVPRSHGVKEIVLACMRLHNMLRAQRGAAGRTERDLEDQEISYHLKDGRISPDPPNLSLYYPNLFHVPEH